MIYQNGYYSSSVGDLGNAAAIVSSGAATAATLYAVAAGAQAVPVVGQILGGIALVAGFIAAGRAKAKAAKEAQKEVGAATVELLELNSQLDTDIYQSRRKIEEINAEITRYGLNGLDGIGTWLKKTFTPGRYQEGILADQTASYEQLSKSVEEKLAILQNFQSELEALLRKLTQGKTEQQVLLWVGGSAIAGSIVSAIMGKPIASVGLALAGFGSIGYVLYKRHQGSSIPLISEFVPGEITNNVLPSQQVATVTEKNSGKVLQSDTISNVLAQYEGKGIRNQDTGAIYKVVNGVLRQMSSPAVMKRELGTDKFEQLVAAKVITQLPSGLVNQYPIGPVLNGLGRLLR